MTNFYANIPAFTDFEQIQDLTYFHQAPEDWLVVITDIKGSTQAAAEGRAKDVNMLGAAVITLLSNHLQSLKTPFVFGGDGATLLMPMHLFSEMRPSFVGLMKLAKEKFQLHLRVGAVRVGDLSERGLPTLVGKYETSPQTQFAQFLGSGFSEAEKWIKAASSEAMILREDEVSSEPNLDGLSCRLKPFKSQNGVIVTLIVKSNTNDNSAWIRGPLFSEIKKILKDDLRSVNPIRRDALMWPLISKSIRLEIALAPIGLASAIKVILRALLANVILKLNMKAGDFIADRYKTEFPLRSDFKKFDDNLRMVIDCTEAQFKAIEDLLVQGRAEGRILFGLNKTRSAVVTCITRTASKGEHIHFVDGENCGYTHAALQIKRDLNL